MKIICKNLVIEGKEFVLVYYNDNKMYGTISYDDIDECGRLKRRLNGFDMSIRNSIDECLKCTKRNIMLNNFIKENNLDLSKSDDFSLYAQFLMKID